MNINPNKKAAVQSAQLRQLFSASYVAMASSTLLASILAYTQREVIEPSVTLIWFSLIVLVAFSRAGLVYTYQSSPTSNHFPTYTWLVKFRLGAIVGGMVWGSAGFLMFPVSNPQHQMFLIFMLAGLSAGGVVSLSADLVSAITFSITSLLPIVIRLFIAGDDLSIAMSMSATLYLGFIIFSLRDINRNITENIILRLEAAAREEMLRISAIAFESHSGMIVTDPNAIILRVNKAFTEITGYSDKEALGKTPHLLNSDRHDKAFFRTMWDNLKKTGYWQGEIWNRHKNGMIFAEWLTISAVTTEEGVASHYVGTYSDITQNKDAVAEIHRLAYYDPLTQLPNRRLLQDRLGQELAAATRSGLHGAILFIDLDNFKILNDTRGHDVGDQLLIEVAKRLRSSVREYDVVGRLGGDEFVVLLQDLNQDAESAAILTEQVAGKVLDALTPPYDFDDYEIYCTASIGIRLYRDQGTVKELLRHADIAMYQAKIKGGKSLCFFDPAMQTMVTDRADMEKDLRHALEQDQFKLYFQAQVNQCQINGAEVLLRWLHPERGLVSPVEFIPLAENTSLILPIGQWVLKTACAQLKSWEGKPHTSNMHLAVNISTRQFRQPDFVKQVQDVLSSSSINPQLLKLEITEGLVLDNIQDTIIKMHSLRDIGVRFSLDDFGIGYSSLSYLTQLPLDQLKIDRFFVQNIGEKPSDEIIVHTIISMAHKLGIEVIAEGVETEEQRTFLDLQGCPACQGFLFSKPLPIQEFDQLVDCG
jgi:diguanylate cyclase (GGDEF)-like protein/PAS domain S-box-containing protein